MWLVNSIPCFAAVDRVLRDTVTSETKRIVTAAVVPEEKDPSVLANVFPVIEADRIFVRETPVPVESNELNSTVRFAKGWRETISRQEMAVTKYPGACCRLSGDP